MTVDLLSEDPTALAFELLACPADRRAAWVAARRGRLGLGLLEALKQYSDSRLLSDPAAADEATCCALDLAQRLPDEPLALPLACWARGNWEVYHDPQGAIQSYRSAMAGYQAVGDRLSVARLLSNLVFACCDCGLFVEAQAAYAQAQASLRQLGEDASLYLLVLEQNYGVLLRNQGRYHESLAVHERALALAGRLGRGDKVAEVQVNRALTLGMLGRLAEGEAALLQSRETAQEHGQALTMARIDMNLGELYAALGRPADALRRFHVAREQFVALDNQMEVGTALLCEARLFEQIGALREARRGYAQAQARFAALSMRPYVGEALLRGAAANRRYGDFSQATRMLDEAESLWRSLDQPVWQTLALFERATLALAHENAVAALDLLRTPLPSAAHPALETQRDLLVAEALALQWKASARADQREAAQLAYERALSSARSQGSRWIEREALAGLGRLSLADDLEAARAYLESAAAHDDLTRQDLSVEELKASFQAQASDLLPLLARLAIDREQPLAALAYAWRAKGSALLELLHASEVDRALPAADPVELDRLRQQLAGRRWLAALQATAEVPESLRERADPTIRELEERLRELRRRRNRLAAAGASAALADPRRLLQAMEADLLVEYLRCGDMLLVVRADRAGDCRAIVLAEVGELLDLLDELRLDFQNVVAQHPESRARQGDLWLDECHPLLRRCYDLLIAPLGDLPAVGADADRPLRLLIAPTAPLDLFPFGACWDGQRYLVERCEIQITPCGALLAAPPPEARATSAPLIIAASAEGRLEGAAREATAVHEALPGSICLVDDPRSLDYLTQLEAAPRLLHIAAHSTLREDAPIFSALHVAGGLLSVEQCYQLSLEGTELVTLSGCTTGAGLDTGGALLAFQSALIVAGARQVLSSLWQIDDEASAVWMNFFYRFLANGMPPASALRQAQRALIDIPAYCHPAIWAAFICSGR